MMFEVYVKQDGIHSQRPTPPTAFSVPNQGLPKWTWKANIDTLKNLQIQFLTTSLNPKFYRKLFILEIWGLGGPQYCRG